MEGNGIGGRHSQPSILSPRLLESMHTYQSLLARTHLSCQSSYATEMAVCLQIGGLPAYH